MQNDTENQEKIDKIRRLIDEARKARDTDTVKALGETMFELTGVQEPEFAAVEPSGNPDLDKLRKHLVDAIAARDEETEATLREMIKKEEGEKLPEVTVELTEEECVEVIENPFDVPENDLGVFAIVSEDGPLSKETLEAIVSPDGITAFALENLEASEGAEPSQLPKEELTPFVAEDYEEKPIEEVFKDILGLTQISALRKSDLRTDIDIKKRIFAMNDDGMTALVQINGIGRASAKTILETLGYEA